MRDSSILLGKRKKRKEWFGNLDGSSAIPYKLKCKSLHYTYPYINEYVRRVAKHLALLRTGSAPSFIQRVTSIADKACTKGVAGRPDNCALWIELAKMLNIP